MEALVLMSGLPGHYDNRDSSTNAAWDPSMSVLLNYHEVHENHT